MRTSTSQQSPAVSSQDVNVWSPKSAIFTPKLEPDPPNPSTNFQTIVNGGAELDDSDPVLPGFSERTYIKHHSPVLSTVSTPRLSQIIPTEKPSEWTESASSDWTLSTCSTLASSPSLVELSSTPRRKRGIPELLLPPIEPLTIPELTMENGQGAVRVRAQFSNITATGSGNYTVGEVRSNLRTLRLDLHLRIPEIELQGHYDIAGNVLLFPIQSRGDFWALFGDVQSLAMVQGIEELRDGIRYMRIARLLIDFSLGSARFRVVDQLNGNNVIGQAMNQFLNQHSEEIINEMKPAARASIAKHFMSFLNAAFTKVPLKVWLHDA